MSKPDRNRGGLSVRTLAIASAASALATYLVPMIWQPGTIPAAAATPVIVALISEALSRPAEHVSQAGRLVRVPRRRLSPRGLDPLARRRLRLAVITGLLAFVVAAVIITTTELAAGGAVSSDQRTTLLGGETAPSDEPEDPAITPSPTVESPATASPDVTGEPGTEVTPDATPPATATPTPTAPAPTATPTPPAGAAPTVTPAPVAP